MQQRFSQKDPGLRRQQLFRAALTRYLMKGTGMREAIRRARISTSLRMKHWEAKRDKAAA